LRRPVFIKWEISSFFGWGTYGMNLALQLEADPDLRAVCAVPFHEKAIVLDPLRARKLQPFLERSRQCVANLAQHAGKNVTVDAPVLTSLGNNFAPSKSPTQVELTGSPTIGVSFFEVAQLPPDALARAAAYPLLVVGSSWGERVLRAHGLTNVATVLQGVDPSIFHPGPRSGLWNDRFVVFSGGKLERRKGQDLVLAAFAKFSTKRPDALLVTAWHSPFPAIARSVDVSGLAPPVTYRENGTLDVVSWAAAAGVPSESFVDLGAIPNAITPLALREADVALFPNRAEGGTNLVAMEAMACGVPTILSANTGHLDLIGAENCYALERQGRIDGVGAGIGDTPGWGESDLNDIVDALDAAYLNRSDARRRGQRGAETMERLTWAETARRMKTLICL
jgi:glycosyltransferase involved in cell wall biosynthesis